MEGNKEAKISKSKLFFALSLSFLLGIFSASFSRIDQSHLLILTAVSVGIFVLNFSNKRALVFSMAILFFAAGAWRANRFEVGTLEKIRSEPRGPAEFFAVVTQEPEISEKYQKLVVKGEEGGVGGKKILINTDLEPIFEFGDGLKIRCILDEPKNFGESNFDYKMYLGKDGIYRVCSKSELTLIKKNDGNKIYSAILDMKNAFESRISATFPDPEGAYLKGLILGGSKRMTADMNSAFSKTGTTHTVAVSGYNVTIVAAFLMWLGIFFGLWRQQVFSFAVVGIILFVLMTGAPSSAVRAGIMGSLVIWAMKEGRLANSKNAILCAASLMLAVNPLLLRYDAGFQLSFLATLGIVWLYPLFEKFFFKSEQNIIKETILMTLAAQFFVLPIILSNFENISLISPLANLLILPAIPYIMLGGFVSGLIGFVSIPLAKAVGFLPYLMLKFELAIVQWLAGIPWASIEIKNFGEAYISVYYFILAGLLYFFQRKSRSQPALEL